MITINQPVTWAIAQPVAFGQGGGVLIAPPPCFDEVLTWHTGTVEDDIYLKDSASTLGDYRLQLVDVVCLAFNGIDVEGENGQVNIREFAETGVKFSIVMGGDGTKSLNLCMVVITSDINNTQFKLQYHEGGYLQLRCGNGVGNNAADSGPVVPGVVYEVEAYYRDEVITLIVNGTTYTRALSGRSSDVQSNFNKIGNDVYDHFFNGTMWAIDHNGSHFPCIGKTSTIDPTTTSATDGTVMTIVSSDYAAVWAGVQQSYFYEVVNGYWEDVDGRYPFAKSGATFVPAGWNHPMCKFQYPEPVDAAIIAADPNNIYGDGLGNAYALTQTEIEANPFINTNAQNFFGNGEKIDYENPIVDPCLTDTLLRVGAIEPLLDKDDDSVIHDKDDNSVIYVKVI